MNPTSNWLAVWKFAIGDPSPEKIEQLLADPHASLERALRWVFLTGMVVTGALFLFPFLLGAIFAGVELPKIAGVGLLGIILVLPIGGALITLSFLLNLGTIHFCAKLFGNVYPYRRLVYPMAAVLCPFAFINLGLLYIPVLGWSIMTLSTIYQLIVVILTIKGVYHCSWFHAIVIGIIPPATLQIIFSCLYYVLYVSLMVGSFSTTSNP